MAISTIDFGPPRGEDMPHYKGYFALNPNEDDGDEHGTWVWAVEVRYADGLLDHQGNGYASSAQEAISRTLECHQHALAYDRMNPAEAMPMGASYHDGVYLR